MAPLFKTRAWVEILFDDFIPGSTTLLTFGGLTSLIGSRSSIRGDVSQDMAKYKGITIERKVDIIIFVVRWFGVVINNFSRNPIINMIPII